MRPGYRSLSGFLCAALLASGSGCTSSQEQAASEMQALYPGMSMKEVAEQLGDPAQVIKGDPGTETVWIYRFEGGASVAAIVLLTILFVAIVVALAFAGGGGSFGGGGGGGGDGPPCQIRVRFDGDGRLIDVSPPEPVPGT
jgi:outer membrane protein assembly factor BamE (lipoprotein component of BamABCDE complex)